MNDTTNGYCPGCEEVVEADPIDLLMGTVPSCPECGEFLTERCDG